MPLFLALTNFCSSKSKPSKAGATLWNVHLIRSSWMGNSCRRVPLMILLLWFIFIFITISHCHGSRSTNVFNLTPNSPHQQTGHFLGFLPRHFPIPSSGPSRKHNDIGLQNWRSPWWSFFFFNKKVTCFFFLNFFLFYFFLLMLKQKWWWGVGWYCKWGLLVMIIKFIFGGFIYIYIYIWQCLY